MKKFTKEMVTDYADKLMIGLTEEEAQMVLDEFEIIDESIAAINQIPNIEAIEPMSYCLDDFVCSLREDVVEESVSLEEISANCSDADTDGVHVPKVVE